MIHRHLAAGGKWRSIFRGVEDRAGQMARAVSLAALCLLLLAAAATAGGEELFFPLSPLSEVACVDEIKIRGRLCGGGF